jgi:hypothetical protein
MTAAMIAFNKTPPMMTAPVPASLPKAAAALSGGAVLEGCPGDTVE